MQRYCAASLILRAPRSEVLYYHSRGSHNSTTSTLFLTLCLRHDILGVSEWYSSTLDARQLSCLESIYAFILCLSSAPSCNIVYRVLQHHCTRSVESHPHQDQQDLLGHLKSTRVDYVLVVLTRYHIQQAPDLIVCYGDVAMSSIRGVFKRLVFH